MREIHRRERDCVHVYVCERERERERELFNRCQPLFFNDSIVQQLRLLSAVRKKGARLKQTKETQSSLPFIIYKYFSLQELKKVIIYFKKIKFGVNYSNQLKDLTFIRIHFYRTFAGSSNDVGMPTTTGWTSTRRT